MEIIRAYQHKKQCFSKDWGVDADQYDYCFDIYGNEVNQAYLDGIEAADRQRQQAYSSYQRTSSSNYSGGYDYSRLFGTVSGAYSDGDRAMLKQFYRSLSKIYHPDANLDTDTHAEMVLLNKLKEEWGV